MPPHESTPLLSSEGGPHQDRPSVRSFVKSSRHLLFGGWLNALLIFVPICLWAEHAEWSAVARFTTSFIAIVPLAKILGDATEQLSMTMGQTIGGLLNASFGNAVELIVAIAALLKDELELVKTSLLGSVLSNVLLVLGMSFFASGFYFSESTFAQTAAQTSTSLLTLSCITLIIPAACMWNTVYSADAPDHWSQTDGTKNILTAADPADPGLLTLSHGTAIVLLLTYLAYLYFQLSSHHTLFEAEEEEHETPDMDRWSAGVWLLVVTVVTAFSADVLVGSIDETATQWNIPKRFIGMILLPVVGNAAEHLTSVWMACKGKMELTIGVSVGSSIQIAAGMIPLMVIIAWPLHKPLTLYFNNFDTIIMFVTVILVNLLLQDGRTNYLEGLMLMALYFVVALSLYVQ